MRHTKQYRIKLFSGADTLAQQLAVLAAKANGGHWLTLNDLKMVVDADKIKYPVLYGDFTAEIIGDKILHLDTPGKDGYQTVMAIEEIELLEVDVMDEIENEESEGLGGLAE